MEEQGGGRIGDGHKSEETREGKQGSFLKERQRNGFDCDAMLSIRSFCNSKK